MTAFAGLRGTGNFATDERPKNFREAILWLNPNGQAPLFALMARMAAEGVNDPQFGWFEEEQKVTRLVTTGALNTTSTAVVLQASTASGVHGTGLSLVVGDLLLVEKAVPSGSWTNEIVTVAAVTDATNITITRGAANTTAANIPTASYLTKLGNAFAEGTASPTVSSRNPEGKYNLCQIFKTAYEVTNTTLSTKFRTGDPLKNDKHRKMFDHSAAIEYSLLFGQRYETTGANGKPLRYTGGLMDQTIGLSSTLFATSPTENDFLDTIEPLFRSTAAAGVGNERIAFCGNSFLNAINKKFKDSSSTRINFNGILNVYGMQMQRFLTPFGEIAFKTHPLMNNHTLYTKSAFVIAPPLLKWRELRATKGHDNIQSPDEDTTKGQWLTEAGLEIHHPSLMAHFHITTP